MVIWFNNLNKLFQLQFNALEDKSLSVDDFSNSDIDSDVVEESKHNLCTDEYVLSFSPQTRIQNLCQHQ